MRVFASILLVCLSMAPVVSAQDLAQPQHKKLKELEGKWTFVLKSQGAPDSKGTCTYKMECGGLWLSSDFNTEFGGVKFQGKGLDGYDPNKKKYVSVWVDSMTPAPMFFEGDYDAKGEKLNMQANAPGPDGKPGVWRSVTIINDAKKHTFEMFFKPQGGEETQMMTVIYSRE